MRVRRLGAGAIALLARLSHRDTRVAWQETRGIFVFLNGHDAPGIQVWNRTLEALTAPRLLARDVRSPSPTYIITEHGRDFLRSHQREMCAAAGRDCFACVKRECNFGPDD